MIESGCATPSTPTPRVALTSQHFFSDCNEYVYSVELIGFQYFFLVALSKDWSYLNIIIFVTVLPDSFAVRNKGCKCIITFL